MATSNRANNNTTSNRKPNRSSSRGSSSTPRRSTAAKNSAGTRSKKTSSANKSAGSRAVNTGRYSQNNGIQLDPKVKRDIYLGGAFIVALVIFLCMIGVIKGLFGPYIKTFMLGFFGSLGYIMPLLILLAICFFVANDDKSGKFVLRFSSFTVLTFMIGIFLALINKSDIESISSNGHVFSDLYNVGGGGGILFGLPAVWFIRSLGKAGSIILSVLLGVLAIVFISGKSIHDFISNFITNISSINDEYEEDEDGQRRLALSNDRDRRDRDKRDRLEEIADKKYLEKRRNKGETPVFKPLEMPPADSYDMDNPGIVPVDNSNSGRTVEITESTEYSDNNMGYPGTSLAVVNQDDNHAVAVVEETDRREKRTSKSAGKYSLSNISEAVTGFIDQEKLRKAEKELKREREAERMDDERILSASITKDDDYVAEVKRVSKKDSRDDVHEITLIPGRTDDLNATSAAINAVVSTVDKSNIIGQHGMTEIGFSFDDDNNMSDSSPENLTHIVSENKKNTVSEAEKNTVSDNKKNTVSEAEQNTASEIKKNTVSEAEKSTVSEIKKNVVSEIEENVVSENPYSQETADDVNDVYETDQVDSGFMEEDFSIEPVSDKFTMNADHLDNSIDKNSDDNADDNAEYNVAVNPVAVNPVVTNTSAYTPASSSPENRPVNYHTEEHETVTVSSERSSEGETRIFTSPNGEMADIYSNISKGISIGYTDAQLSQVPEPVTERTHEANRMNAADNSASGANGDSQIRKIVHRREDYIPPSIDCLKINDMRNGGDSDNELKETALKLKETLEIFGVSVDIDNISQGPSVTRYEMKLKPGIKVSKILGLADDIQLALAAKDVRIEAPIPGKSAVGIEIPNKSTTPVLIRDLIESSEFDKAESKLTFGVGKDISGQAIIADIGKMPHMLIAGSTGSGKSVCINTLIMSILYKAHPDDVKLIMIDPKIVELSVYNNIPHLLIPVVTDPKKASAALKWAVNEMTERYTKFADQNVRDLKGYNQKMETLYKEGVDDAKKLPQIIVIVDELADLMMVASKEVEESICRLTQLARAAGIHLIIATQRPSVDVITGLIKNNMPSRVAFKVTSAIDSRTILDTGGAEKLLGKGDMLFYPQGYVKPLRVQGAFVSDDEVNNVVEDLKKNNMGYVTEDFIDAKINSMSKGDAQPDNDSSGTTEKPKFDEYFREACKVVVEKGSASSGMLQRMYRIGFNRAARMVDDMEKVGIVGQEQGTKPRQVLVSMAELEGILNSIGV